MVSVKRNLVIFISVFTMILIFGCKMALADMSFDLFATTYDSGTSPNTLVNVDKTTGQQTAVGILGLTKNVQYADVNPQTGRLYGIDYVLDKVVEIDRSTGLTTPVTSINYSGHTVSTAGMAFAPNGTLYVYSFFDRKLGIVNLNTGSFQPVYSNPSYQILTMDFSPSGVLYAYPDNPVPQAPPQEIWTIDTDTWTIDKKPINGNYRVGDMDFAPDGFIYHTNFSDGLVRIDPNTGQQAFIGRGNDALLAIASQASLTTPEPGILLLLGSGLLGLMTLRRRFQCIN